MTHFAALGSMNSITPESPEEHVAEGGNINLTCKYEGVINNIQWYRQYQRSRPEFLLSITESGSIYPTGSVFSAHINKEEKRVNLEIISAKVTDSAVYYCAVKPNAGYKMIFGSGTRLNIEPKDEFEPSYYKLKDGNNTEACLATGFSRQNATKLDPKNEGLFNNSEAVLISEEPLDGLFNQVALLNSTSEGKCQGKCK